MNEEKYCWKVVTPAHNIPFIQLCSANYVSVWATGKLALRYDIGIEVNPFIGKIFAFDTYKHATRYRSNGDKILQCMYTGNAIIPKSVLTFTYIGDNDYITEFWRCELYNKSEETMDILSSPPPGTILVDSLIPIQFC